jgi:single-stranded-DNA-specific exonuclease
MGLGVIREGKRLGIKALLEVADIKPDKVTASTLGFQLGPRLNAAGRLGDAMQAVKLLRSRDETEAKQIAAQLNESNLSRRELEKQIVEQATQEIMAAPADWVNVVGRSTWHPGVVGIVAARLVEKFGKPAIVVGEGGKGSGRSVPKFHLHEALCEVSDCLQGFGGHAHAVGVHIDLDDIELLRDALNEHAATVLTVDDLQQTILYDGELPLSHIDLALVNTLSAAAPFGRGNAEPVFRINGVTVTDLRELKGGHFKGKLAGGPSFIAFGLGAKAHLMEAPVDMLVVAEVNEWMGRRELQLRVKDIELCA